MSDEEFGGSRCQCCSNNYGTYDEYPSESYRKRQKQKKADDAMKHFFEQRARFRAMQMLFKFLFFLLLAFLSFLLIKTCINGKTVERKAEGIVVSKIVKNSRGFTILDVSGNAYPVSSLSLLGGTKSVEVADLVNVFGDNVYAYEVHYETVLKNAQPGLGTYSLTIILIFLTICSFLWFLSGPTEDNFKD